MSKEVSVLTLGALIAFLPFLGLPGSWRTIVMIVAGLIVAVIGIMLRREALARGSGGSRGTSFFVDNRSSESVAALQEERPRVQ